MPDNKPTGEPTQAEWDAAERRRSLFQQFVRADYEIVRGVLRPVKDLEDEGRPYFPIATPAIAGDFVRLRIGDTEALLAFARRWGLLGHDDLAWRDSLPFRSWARGDPVAWIWAHLSGVQTALSLWKFWREQDDAALAQYVQRRRASNSRWGSLEPVYKLLAKRKFVDAQQLIEGHLAKPSLSAGETSGGILVISGNDSRVVVALLHDPKKYDSSFVWGVVRRIINPNLRGVHAQISISAEQHPDRPIVAQGWDSVMSVIYRHIFEILASGEVEECRECQTPFIRTDGRQRFCPPPPWARESQCAMRFHKREQRRRARQADVAEGP